MNDNEIKKSILCEKFWVKIIIGFFDMKRKMEKNEKERK